MIEQTQSTKTITMAGLHPARPMAQAGGGSSMAGLGESYDPTQGEKAVWRAVIVQALMDAASLSGKKENRQHREEALIWLRGNTPDFNTVCHNAGFEPDYVRGMIRLSLERQCRWRAEPGTGAPRKRRNRAPSSRQHSQRR